MSAINEQLLKLLAEKLGSSIQFKSNEILSEILEEVQRERLKELFSVPGYDRTYTQGYDKEDYSKADYHRYDKTIDPGNIKERINAIDFGEIIIEKLKKG